MIATVKKVMFGIHTASIVGITPFTANVVDMVVNNTYNALNASPMPKFSPIPPLILRDESDTPIIAMMSTDMAVENRR